MNDLPIGDAERHGGDEHSIPKAEEPRQNLDSTLERLEESTLEKRAKSPALRDVHEREQHFDSLNRRIDVLQRKLDLREEEILNLLPEVSRLRQAEQISQVLVRDGTIIFGIGGALVSVAGLFAEGILRYSLVGFGLALFICGLWIAKILNSFVWPIRRPGP